MVDWITRWLARNTPNREELARSRWIGPFGKRVLRSDLWRFTRRSVPRGVGVGILVGIFLMIPGLQIIGAALLSVPFRANIPIAAAMTFLSNPATTPFIVGGSFMVGNFFGFGGDPAAFKTMWERGASLGEWLRWLASDAAPAALGGLLIVATVTAAAGYFISIVVWRWWQARKWRRRSERGVAAAD